MRAVILPTVNEPLTVQEVPSPVLKTGEAKNQPQPPVGTNAIIGYPKESIPVSKRQPYLGLMDVA